MTRNDHVARAVSVTCQRMLGGNQETEVGLAIERLILERIAANPDESDHAAIVGRTLIQIGKIAYDLRAELKAIDA